MLYWSYRRARPIWLVSLGLGALLFFVGRTESNPAMGFALLLVGGILVLTGFAGFVAFEAVNLADPGGLRRAIGRGTRVRRASHEPSQVLLALWPDDPRRLDLLPELRCEAGLKRAGGRSALT